MTHLVEFYDPRDGSFFFTEARRGATLDDAVDQALLMTEGLGLVFKLSRCLRLDGAAVTDVTAKLSAEIERHHAG